MSQQAQEIQQEQGRFGEIARGLMGDECLGTFGPQSDTETNQADDYSNPEYAVIGESKSSCMDDRGEGLCVQLPGNRAISEVVGEYTDINIPAEKISEKIASKTRELVASGHTPRFHGDKASGKEGCAALLYMRDSLAYMAENPDKIAQMAYDRLRLLGIDTVSIHDLKMRCMIAGQRAEDETLWDAGPEQLIDIAVENRAEYDEYEGAHHTVGPREDLSPHAFDNESFKKEHKTDDGHPLGALSLTYGLYVKRLVEEGFTQAEITEKTVGVMLHSAAMIKLACKEEAVDVMVGYGMVD